MLEIKKKFKASITKEKCDIVVSEEAHLFTYTSSLKVSPKWTKQTKWTEMDWIDQSGSKWIEWTNMDWSGPNRPNGLKCYFDVAQ